MKWRTDKPTANVIVALVRYNHDSANGLQITVYDFRVLKKIADDFYLDFHSDREHIPTDRITKWADLEENEMATDIELIQKSWYRQGYIDGINKQEPQWILEELKYKENPKYGQPLETVTDCHHLEDEVKKYINDNWEYGYPPENVPLCLYIFSNKDVLDAARHFAKWGAEHLEK